MNNCAICGQQCSGDNLVCDECHEERQQLLIEKFNDDAEDDDYRDVMGEEFGPL